MFERGGRNQVAILPWTILRWGRTLDDTSSATVGGVANIDAACCAVLSAVFPWRHEIVLQRNGDVVWAGPITLLSVDAGSGSYEIQARDLSAWWDHRKVHHDIELNEVDLAVIFQAIADDALAPDPSPNFTVTTTACGVKGSRRILAAQNQIAGPQLRDLSTTGIDWTAIAREIRAGGLTVPTDALLTFHDGMFFSPPKVTRDGTQQSDAVTTRGAGGGELGDTLYATEEDAFAVRADGLLESVESVSTLADYPSVQQYSTSKLALDKLVVSVDAAIVTPEAPYTIDQLVPGARCPLALNETCIPVFDDYRLQTVSVSAGSDTPEQVQVTFQPLGTTR